MKKANFPKGEDENKNTLYVLSNLCIVKAFHAGNMTFLKIDLDTFFTFIFKAYLRIDAHVRISYMMGVFLRNL